MAADTGDIIRGEDGLRAPQQFKVCAEPDLAPSGPCSHGCKVDSGKKIWERNVSSPRHLPLPTEAGQLVRSPHQPLCHDAALPGRRKGTTS